VKRAFGFLMLLGGMALLCLGLYGLVSGEREPRQVFGGLGLCLALLLVGGSWSRGSRQAPSEKDARARPERPGADGPSVTVRQETKESLGNPLNPDLSLMNGLGWVLLSLSFAVVLAAAILIVLCVPDSEAILKDWRKLPVGVGVLLLAVGFFQLGKHVLGALGLSIYN
jgi:hypothetical protein